MELRPDAATSVQRAINHATNIGRGRVAALPAFKEDVRTARRDRAPSVLAHAMQTWLASDEATAWRIERAAMFREQLRVDMRGVTARMRPARCESTKPRLGALRGRQCFVGRYVLCASE